MKAHTFQSVEGRDAQDRVQRSSAQILQLSGPHGAMASANISPATVCDDIAKEGNTPEPWCPEFLLELDHLELAGHPGGCPLSSMSLEVELLHDPMPPGKQRHSYQSNILMA